MDEIDIWQTVKAYVDRYGERAPAEAAIQAERFLKEGDEDGAALWCRIVTAAEELLRTEPTGLLH